MSSSHFTIIAASCVAWWSIHASAVGVEIATSPAHVEAEAVQKLNASAVEHPANAEAPGMFSVDHAAHEAAYGFQAPSIAVLPLEGGHVRVWLAWYQQNKKPGGGAIGGGSIPHDVYAYCNNPFAKAEPVWTRVIYMDPVLKHGDETCSDPEVAQMPDGRLLCSYITSGPGRDRKRSTYAFVITNPRTTSGEFRVARQQWLEYGVLSQPFQHQGAAYAVIDEWSVARRFCRIESTDTPEHNSIRAVRLSDIPWPNHPKLTIFFESSMHAVGDHQFRAYRRTTEGLYTVLSDDGGRTWGTEVKWPDHATCNSRSAFAKSPYSGRIIGAVNCPRDGTKDRTNLTLVLSDEDGAPGSFKHTLNIEPDDGQRKVAAQYPRLAFDSAGFVYCTYRWSDKCPGAPHHGAGIVVARVREDLLAAGKATLSDVEKRTACELTLAK